jgi:hypothetical protein
LLLMTCNHSQQCRTDTKGARGASTNSKLGLT